MKEMIKKTAWQIAVFSIVVNVVSLDAYFIGYVGTFIRYECRYANDIDALCAVSDDRNSVHYF